MNYKETTPTKILNDGIWESTLNYVCTHRPVRMVCSNRPNIMLVLATDYEDMALELEKRTWVDVNERRPEMDRDGDGTAYEESSPEVLCIDNRGNTKTLMYVFTKDEAYWFDFERWSESYFQPTHWMPLPAKD